jgi:hypothetical protein
MALRSPSIARALSAALRDTQFLERDRGTVALARRYAALIEEAAAVAEELERVIPEDESTAQQLARLRSRCDAMTVASDLGPKLLAALTALGMTPAARAASTKGGTPDVGNPAGDALARLRAARGRG